MDPQNSTFTTLIHLKVDRLRAGDRAASDELLRAASKRLESLTRKMIRDFPTVQRWTDADDILQNASMRLLRALAVMRPESTRDFFHLAAVQIRRELIDLARRLSGPRGMARHHDSVAGLEEVASASTLDARLEAWAEFHLAVEKLPAEEREVFGLVFYHGWQQQDVADFCQVNVRTVRRRWHAALMRLHEFAQILIAD